MDLRWTIRTRDFSKEAPPISSAPAASHPLQFVQSAAKKSKAAGKPDLVVDDPLSSATSDPLSAPSDPLTAASFDPLTGTLSDPLSTSNTFSSLGSVQLQGAGAVASYGSRKSRFLDWKERRGLILKQYAVTGHLRVSSDLLNVDGVATAALGSNLDDGNAVSDKRVESQLDMKTRRRLEQLGAVEDDGSSTVRLTQQELVSRVETLESDLRRAWEAEERVRSLKIAIQVCEAA